MTIKEFIWLYRETNKNIPICNEALDTYRKKYVVHMKKRNPRATVLINEIFNVSQVDKKEEFSFEEDEESVYHIVLVTDGKCYQVETHKAHSQDLLCVNGGFGEELWDEKTAQEFIEVLTQHCTILTVREEPATLSFDFQEGRNHFRWLATSLIRANQARDKLLSKEDFATHLLDTLSEERKKN